MTLFQTDEGGKKKKITKYHRILAQDHLSKTSDNRALGKILPIGPDDQDVCALLDWLRKFSSKVLFIRHVTGLQREGSAYFIATSGEDLNQSARRQS